MTVTVLFFGHYSDYFAEQPQTVQVEEGTTVRALADQLAARDPRLANITAHCRFAVGDEYATLDQSLHDNCTVAVLPPMSGG